MSNLEFFKKKAKNLHKDFKTRFFNEESKLYEYKPKYFDIGKIFIDFDFPDYKDDFTFTLMNAQHLIAKMVRFENWRALISADKEEQRLAHRRLDLSAYKLGSPFAKLHDNQLKKALYTMPHSNDCAMLVKEKSHALGFGEPVYRSAAYQGFDSERFKTFNLQEIPLEPPMGFTAKNPETGLYDFSVKIGTHFFVGSGANLTQAKFAVDKKAYRFLCHEEQKKDGGEVPSDFVSEESEEWGIPVRYSGLMAIKEYREKWGINWGKNND